MIKIVLLDLIKARVASLDHVVLSGRQGGVTPGGHAIDTRDNTAWYMKHHEDPQHAYGEHLANKVYRALGHNAPHSMVLHKHDGSPVYMSKIIPKFGVLGHDPDAWHDHPREAAAKFSRGVAADVLLRNYDLHGENVGIVPTAHHGAIPTRIDNGSVLHFRATGGTDDYRHAAQDHGFSDIHEGQYNTHRMHRKAVGVQAGTIHDVTSPKALQPQLHHILKVRAQYKGWHNFVREHIPGASTQTKEMMGDLLEHRTHRIVQHVKGEKEF